jgi:hypothetical protein
MIFPSSSIDFRTVCFDWANEQTEKTSKEKKKQYFMVFYLSFATRFEGFLQDLPVLLLLPVHSQ